MPTTIVIIIWLVLGGIGALEVWRREIRQRGFDGKSEMLALVFASVIIGPLVFIIGLSLPKFR